MPMNAPSRRGRKRHNWRRQIVAWLEASKLKAAGFVLHQEDEIEAHGPITEEINFGTYRQRPITEIEQSTGLRFPELVLVDTHQG